MVTAIEALRQRELNKIHRKVWIRDQATPSYEMMLRDCRNKIPNELRLELLSAKDDSAFDHLIDDILMEMDSKKFNWDKESQRFLPLDEYIESKRREGVRFMGRKKKGWSEESRLKHSVRMKAKWRGLQNNVETTVQQDLDDIIERAVRLKNKLANTLG